jgi:hypothetical protein
MALHMLASGTTKAALQQPLNSKLRESAFTTTGAERYDWHASGALPE